MKEKNGKITDILAAAVFAVFALCVLLVLLAAAGVYRDLVDSGEERFLRRTAAQYLTMRVRQAESVERAEFGGCPALVFREETPQEVYLTRVYCYDGSLRELYCPESAQLLPADGEVILPADSICFMLEGNLLTVEMGQDRLFLTIPTGRRPAP